MNIYVKLYIRITVFIKIDTERDEGGKKEKVGSNRYEVTRLAVH